MGIGFVVETTVMNGIVEWVHVSLNSYDALLLQLGEDNVTPATDP